MSRPIPVEEMVRQFTSYHSGSRIFKIDNFSLLEKYQFKKIESSDFDIGSHKWKLLLYPSGNENDNGKGYISLYLEIQDSRSKPSNWQIRFRYQLFILNQFRQDWRAQEGNVVFDASNTKQGFARLISVADLLNPRQGYLVDGCALFGVKILGIGDTKVGTSESFSMIEKPPNNKFSWKMMRFSALNRYPTYESDEFVVGNKKWRIQVYPRGSAEDPDMLAMYLRGEDFTNNAPKAKSYTRYTLKVLDRINAKHVTKTYSYPPLPADRGGSGSTKFMPLKDVHNPSNYLVNDMLYVEVEVDVISMRK